MDNKYLNQRYSTLRELYERELYIRGTTQTDIQFVLSLIRESPLDENLSIMDNDYWKKLTERGLLDVFEDINKANGIEGISISNDMIYRGRGFFIKIESSKAYTVEEFGRYLNSIGGLNVVYPLEKPIYPVESLIDSNIATYSGGTIVYNPYNAVISLFYKSIS
jgi:hypothetical protein